MNSLESTPINSLDVIGLTQLARVYPLQEVREILERTSRYTCLERKLPSEFMFYFVLSTVLKDRSASTISMLKDAWTSYSQVFLRRPQAQMAGAGGLANARIRVNFEPFREAQKIFCKPIAREVRSWTHFNGKRVVAIDATLINVWESEKNAVFGRSKNQHSNGKYPQARIVGLVECGTHAILRAEIGGYHDGELSLAKPIVADLDSSMLILADRLYLGWELVCSTIKSGADLLWRFKAKDKDRFEILEQLEDGSYLARYLPPKDVAAKAPKTEPIPVRVFCYCPEGVNTEEVCLVTTLIDEVAAPAAQLALVYMQRWEIELVFKEMKVDLNRGFDTIRSQRPDLVFQELYAYMLAHYAVRQAMYDAAIEANMDPDQISFKGSVKAIDRNSSNYADCFIFAKNAENLSVASEKLCRGITSLSDRMLADLNKGSTTRSKSEMLTSPNQASAQSLASGAELTERAEALAQKAHELACDPEQEPVEIISMLVQAAHAVSKATARLASDITETVTNNWKRTIEELQSQLCKTSSSRGRRRQRGTKGRNSSHFPILNGPAPKTAYSTFFIILGWYRSVGRGLQ